MRIALEPIAFKYEKVYVYESCQNYLLIGTDDNEKQFRVLKIDRRIIRPKNLKQILHEDPILYSKGELAEILCMIDEGNKNNGGLSRIASVFGLVGFVKFLDCYYMTLITQRKIVGYIGSNIIYTVKATDTIAIKPRDPKESNFFSKVLNSFNKRINATSSEMSESRYMGLYQFIDMTKDFYFSYTYDLTYTLQHNFIISNKNAKVPLPCKEMFAWNYFQMDELRSLTYAISKDSWIIPLVHGFFQQRKYTIIGRTLDLILIARRSRHYAGTRYLKRGVSVHGKVANDCEVEQIVQLDEGSQASFCSCTQMRGSIPTYWYQETSVTMPKPPILLNRRDPLYLATEEHFADLIRRYSSPIMVLDLIKQYERRPRESIVGREFKESIEEINSNIDALQDRLRYFALDYSKITKSKAKTGLEASVTRYTSTKNQQTSQGTHVNKEWDRIQSNWGEGGGPHSEQPDDYDEDDGRSLSTSQKLPPSIFEDSIETTPGEQNVYVLVELDHLSAVAVADLGMFCSTTAYLDRVDLLNPVHVQHAKQRGYLEQRGVLRTNCIDCLDRTNVAQFAMGMKAIDISLRLLGLAGIEISNMYTNPLMLGLMDMYSEMGDKIALQYGGSEAHKKVSSNKNGKKGGELLTSIKRYYSNAFTDMLKQDSMNVFLGCYIPHESSIPLWDLENDWYLHNLLLRPPSPPVYKLLFNSSSKDVGEIFDTEAILQSYVIQSPPPAVDPENEKVVAPCTPQVLAAAAVFQQLASLPDSVLSTIHRCESRKRLSAIMSGHVRQSLQLWYKEANLAYRRSLEPPAIAIANKSTPTIDDSPMDYIDRVYKPTQLTSFDQIFAQEHEKPTDVYTISSMQPQIVSHTSIMGKLMNFEEQSMETTSQRIRTNSSPFTDLPNEDEEKRNEMNDRDVGGVRNQSSSFIKSMWVHEDSVDAVTAGRPYSTSLSGKTASDRQEFIPPTQQGFQLRSYMKSITALIPGMQKDDVKYQNISFASLHKDQTEPISRHNDQSQDSPLHDQFDFYSASSLYYGIDYQKDYNLYVQYANAAETILQHRPSPSPDIRSVSVRNVEQGSATALGIPSSSFYSFPNVPDKHFEKHLEDFNVSVDDVQQMHEQSSRHHITTVLNSGVYKGLSSHYPAVLATETIMTPFLTVEYGLQKTKITTLIQNQGKAVGPKFEMNRILSMYASAEMMFRQDLDTNMLTNFRSNFTNETTILKYISLFDRDFLRGSIHLLCCFLQEPSSWDQKRNSHTNTRPTRIAKFYQVQKLISVLSNSQYSHHHTQAWRRPSLGVGKETMTSNSKGGGSDIPNDTGGEYNGFRKTAPDVYYCVKNPFLKCNEIAAYRMAQLGIM